MGKNKKQDQNETDLLIDKINRMLGKNQKQVEKDKNTKKEKKLAKLSDTYKMPNLLKDKTINYNNKLSKFTSIKNKLNKIRKIRKISMSLKLLLKNHNSSQKQNENILNKNLKELEEESKKLNILFEENRKNIEQNIMLSKKMKKIYKIINIQK